MIAKGADLVIVVGDPKSSNSNRLREVAQKRGIRAYLVDHAAAIQSDWFESVQTIAMTAGASTPETVVQECVQRLRNLGVQTVEEVVYTEENVSFQLPKELSNNKTKERLSKQASRKMVSTDFF
jgi:4-hydroxy-3-methylbut-2-enyl diphosphate reductase